MIASGADTVHLESIVWVDVFSMLMCLNEQWNSEPTGICHYIRGVPICRMLAVVINCSNDIRSSHIYRHPINLNFIDIVHHWNPYRHRGGRLYERRRRTANLAEQGFPPNIIRRYHEVDAVHSVEEPDSDRCQISHLRPDNWQIQMTNSDEHRMVDNYGGPHFL